MEDKITYHLEGKEGREYRRKPWVFGSYALTDFKRRLISSNYSPSRSTVYFIPFKLPPL